MEKEKRNGREITLDEMMEILKMGKEEAPVLSPGFEASKCGSRSIRGY